MKKCLLIIGLLLAVLLLFGCGANSPKPTLSFKQSSIEVRVGESKALEPIVKNLKEYKVNYVVQNGDSYVSVAGGIITGKHVGNATVYASLENFPEAYATIRVTVVNENDSGIELPSEYLGDYLSFNTTISVSKNIISVKGVKCQIEREVITDYWDEELVTYKYYLVYNGRHEISYDNGYLFIGDIKFYPKSREQTISEKAEIEMSKIVGFSLELPSSLKIRAQEEAKYGNDVHLYTYFNRSVTLEELQNYIGSSFGNKVVHSSTNFGVLNASGESIDVSAKQGIPFYSTLGTEDTCYIDISYPENYTFDNNNPNELVKKLLGEDNSFTLPTSPFVSVFINQIYEDTDSGTLTASICVTGMYDTFLPTIQSQLNEKEYQSWGIGETFLKKSSDTIINLDVFADMDSKNYIMLIEKNANKGSLSAFPSELIKSAIPEITIPTVEGTSYDYIQRWSETEDTRLQIDVYGVNSNKKDNFVKALSSQSGISKYSNKHFLYIDDIEKKAIDVYWKYDEQLEKLRIQVARLFYLDVSALIKPNTAISFDMDGQKCTLYQTDSLKGDLYLQISQPQADFGKETIYYYVKDPSTSLYTEYRYSDYYATWDKLSESLPLGQILYYSPLAKLMNTKTNGYTKIETKTICGILCDVYQQEHGTYKLAISQDSKLCLLNEIPSQHIEVTAIETTSTIPSQVSIPVNAQAKFPKEKIQQILGEFQLPDYEGTATNYYFVGREDSITITIVGIDMVQAISYAQNLTKKENASVIPPYIIFEGEKTTVRIEAEILDDENIRLSIKIIKNVPTGWPEEEIQEVLGNSDYLPIVKAQNSKVLSSLVDRRTEPVYEQTEKGYQMVAGPKNVSATITLSCTYEEYINYQNRLMDKGYISFKDENVFEVNQSITFFLFGLPNQKIVEVQLSYMESMNEMIIKYTTCLDDCAPNVWPTTLLFEIPKMDVSKCKVESRETRVLVYGATQEVYSAYLLELTKAGYVYDEAFAIYKLGDHSIQVQKLADKVQIDLSNQKIPGSSFPETEINSVVGKAFCIPKLSSSFVRYLFTSRLDSVSNIQSVNLTISFATQSDFEQYKTLLEEEGFTLLVSENSDNFYQLKLQNMPFLISSFLEYSQESQKITFVADYYPLNGKNINPALMNYFRPFYPEYSEIIIPYDGPQNTIDYDIQIDGEQTVTTIVVHNVSYTYKVYPNEDEGEFYKNENTVIKRHKNKRESLEISWTQSGTELTITLKKGQFYPYPIELMPENFQVEAILEGRLVTCMRKGNDIYVINKQNEGDLMKGEGSGEISLYHLNPESRTFDYYWYDSEGNLISSQKNIELRRAYQYLALSSIMDVDTTRLEIIAMEKINGFPCYVYAYGKGNPPQKWICGGVCIKTNHYELISVKALEDPIPNLIIP